MKDCYITLRCPQDVVNSRLVSNASTCSNLGRPAVRHRGVGGPQSLPNAQTYISDKQCLGSSTHESLISCPGLHFQHFRMLMHARHQSHTHSSPYCLSDLPLIDSPQTSHFSMFYPSNGCDILRHDREILDCRNFSPRTYPQVPYNWHKQRYTLYSCRGLIPNSSKASVSLGLLFCHFICSTGLKSCGAYTSPAFHFLCICLSKSSTLLALVTSANRSLVRSYAETLLDAGRCAAAARSFASRRPESLC